MGDIDAKVVMQLRRATGAGMMDCKKALAESGGDLEKAKDVLRVMGAKLADQKSSRETDEGRVFSYIHAGDRIGVLLEIDCETDFVARNEEFVAYGHDLCLHLAFKRPPYLSREEVPAAEVEKERSFLLDEVRKTMAGKPAEIQEKVVDGRLDKFFEERCFLDQPFVKDDTKTVSGLHKETIARIGENLVIRRFKVFAIGEE